MDHASDRASRDQARHHNERTLFNVHERKLLEQRASLEVERAVDSPSVTGPVAGKPTGHLPLRSPLRLRFAIS